MDIHNKTLDVLRRWAYLEFPDARGLRSVDRCRLWGALLTKFNLLEEQEENIKLGNVTFPRTREIGFKHFDVEFFLHAPLNP